MSPLFKGIGYGMMTVRFLVNAYYVVICAWALFYLFAGFTKNLPWAECINEWNTLDCYTRSKALGCNPWYNETVDDKLWNMTYYSGECVTKEDYCLDHDYPFGYSGVGNDSCVNSTHYYPFVNTTQDNSISPAEDYFNGYVLGVVKDENGTMHTWDDFGELKWDLSLCLLLAWILVTLSLIGGLQSLGKVAYVITLSPYVVLTALIAYTAQLPGAMNGINYYLEPKWEELLEVRVWSKAATQILFSLSVGFGSQLVLASYNSFKNNTQRDAILIAICNSLTSVYAGFVVFTILGFLEHETRSPIDKVRMKKSPDTDA